MLKKVITYENLFTHETVTEEHFFHISKADLVEMEMVEHKEVYTNKEGKRLTGMQAKLQKIVDSEDGQAIIDEMKDFIRRSYGRKVGDRFVKNKDIWEEFSSSEAFSQLIWELCTDAEASAEFLTGIIPNNLEQIAAEVRTAAEAQAAKAKVAEGEEASNGSTASEEPRVLTQAEVTEMDSDELKSGLATGKYELS